MTPTPSDSPAVVHPADVLGEPEAPYASLPALVTPRLQLRPFVALDDAEIVTLFSDPRSLETWVIPPFTSREDARAYRAMLEAGFARRSVFVWGAFERGEDGHEGPLVGVGILTRWAPFHRRVDLGYYLASAFWGRGYATELARALVAFAFETLGVHRVEAEVVPSNHASARVLLRLGFTHEATLLERLWGGGDHPEDSCLHALLRPDFDPAAPTRL